MKWNSTGMFGCALALGLVIGRVSASPASPQAPPSVSAGSSELPTPPGEGEPEAESEQPMGHSYDGIEYEAVKPARELDEIDRMTLKLRAKQPIYFLGVPMRQIPSDNWLMSELIFKIKPDYIIEAGTLYGGSALYYASLLGLVNPNGKVITVDINGKQILRRARAHPLWKRRVKFIKGSSTAPEVIAQIKREIGPGKKVFITLDTLHAPDHVRKELELYSQFVSKGSYIILQDTYYEGLSEVLDEFLASHPKFRRDEKLDHRFIFTKYRGGFLRRE